MIDDMIFVKGIASLFAYHSLDDYIQADRVEGLWDLSD